VHILAPNAPRPHPLQPTISRKKHSSAARPPANNNNTTIINQYTRMSGQFDDAEGDEGPLPLKIVNEQESDDEFVASMRAKMMLLASESPQSPTNDANNPHESEAIDYSDKDDMFDLLDDEDALPTSCKSLKYPSMSASVSSTRINLDSKKMSHAVSNAVTKMQHLESSKRKSHTGRDDRATSEQCLDPRTRLILFRMLSNGFLELIDGCLSTGKEANVYYAKAGRSAGWVTRFAGGDCDGSVTSSSYSNVTFAPLLSPDVTEYAIKIYKTSILVFKDRDKYVSGEHRWRKGYCELLHHHSFMPQCLLCLTYFQHKLNSIRQIKPTQNGKSLGRERNAQLSPHLQRWHSLPGTSPTQKSRSHHGISG
jgi:hypothetical protein